MSKYLSFYSLDELYCKKKTLIKITVSKVVHKVFLMIEKIVWDKILEQREKLF